MMDERESDDNSVEEPGTDTGWEQGTATFDVQGGENWHYAKVSVSSGVGSVLAGSFLIALTIVVLRGATRITLADFLTIWLVFVCYSGFLIIPVSILIGIPLMLFFRNAGNWIWIGACMAVAVLSALIASALTFPASFPGSAAYTLPYGLVYGLFAIVFRRRM